MVHYPLEVALLVEVEEEERSMLEVQDSNWQYCLLCRNTHVGAGADAREGEAPFVVVVVVAVVHVVVGCNPLNLRSSSLL